MVYSDEVPGAPGVLDWIIFWICANTEAPSSGVIAPVVGLAAGAYSHKQAFNRICKVGIAQQWSQKREFLRRSAFASAMVDAQPFSAEAVSQMRALIRRSGSLGLKLKPHLRWFFHWCGIAEATYWPQMRKSLGRKKEIEGLLS